MAVSRSRREIFIEMGIPSEEPEYLQLPVTFPKLTHSLLGEQQIKRIFASAGIRTPDL